MQVTFNVTGAQFSGAFEELMASLSQEDKKEVAKAVLVKMLEDDPEQERQAFSDSVVTELRAYRFKEHSDAQIRASWEYKDKMKTFKSSRQQAYELVTAETVKLYQEMVSQMLQESPRTQEVMAAAQEQFKLDLPRMAEQALTTFFISSMANIGATMANQMNDRIGMNLLSQNLQATMERMGYSGVALPKFF